MLQLSDKWGPKLTSQPETGMGYQVVSIVLKDGTRWNQALVEAGHVTRIKGLSLIPFREDQIADIIITHEKWNFSIDD